MPRRRIPYKRLLLLSSWCVCVRITRKRWNEVSVLNRNSGIQKGNYELLKFNTSHGADGFGLPARLLEDRFCRFQYVNVRERCVVVVVGLKGFYVLYKKEDGCVYFFFF